MAEGGPIDGTSLIQDSWFMERNSQWPGQANSLQVKKVLRHVKTDFQDLLVFESTDYGNVLVLDGVIQLTERDEMSYQEMMAHLPMFSVANPRHVLVIGGGDGGVLREIVKHESVEKVFHCEIDAGVLQAAKDFFPSVSSAMVHAKVEQKVGDGVAFAQAAADNSFDVIVVDSSDPVGPAEGLFSEAFYANAHRILRPGGVLCTQGESLWIHTALIEQVMKINGKLFASAEYATIQVPTYPGGQIGAFLGRKAEAESKEASTCRMPRRPVPSGMPLRYYSSAMHCAAFALPAFVQQRLGGICDDQSLRWA